MFPVAQGGVRSGRTRSRVTATCREPDDPSPGRRPFGVGKFWPGLLQIFLWPWLCVPFLHLLVWNLCFPVLSGKRRPRSAGCPPAGWLLRSSALPGGRAPSANSHWWDGVCGSLQPGMAAALRAAAPHCRRDQGGNVTCCRVGGRAPGVQLPGSLCREQSPGALSRRGAALVPRTAPLQPPLLFQASRDPCPQPSAPDGVWEAHPAGGPR